MTLKMDPSLRELWIDALRSGDFPQIAGRLKVYKEDGEALGYCCWGVLAELCSVPVTKIMGLGEFNFGSGTSINLPSREWVESHGVPHKIRDLLADMNDGDGQYVDAPQTFAQIADYIEANL